MQMKSLGEYRAAAEELAVRKALRDADTKTEAAQALGISRQALYKKLDRFGIPKDLGFGSWSREARDAKGLLETILPK